MKKSKKKILAHADPIELFSTPARMPSKAKKGMCRSTNRESKRTNKKNETKNRGKPLRELSNRSQSSFALTDSPETLPQLRRRKVAKNNNFGTSESEDSGAGFSNRRSPRIRNKNITENNKNILLSSSSADEDFNQRPSPRLTRSFSKNSSTDFTKSETLAGTSNASTSLQQRGRRVLQNSGTTDVPDDLTYDKVTTSLQHQQDKTKILNNTASQSFSLTKSSIPVDSKVPFDDQDFSDIEPVAQQVKRRGKRNKVFDKTDVKSKKSFAAQFDCDNMTPEATLRSKKSFACQFNVDDQTKYDQTKNTDQAGGETYSLHENSQFDLTNTAIEDNSKSNITKGRTYIVKNKKENINTTKSFNLTKSDSERLSEDDTDELITLTLPLVQNASTTEHGRQKKVYYNEYSSC